MFSRVLLGLIDTAILPSLLLFSVKFVTLILLADLWGMDLEIRGFGLFFGDFGSFYKANTVSNLLLLSATFLGLFYYLSRLLLVTERSLHPILSGKIVNWGLATVIKPFGTTCRKAIVWLFLSFFSALSFFTQALLGFSPLFLSPLSASFLIVGVFLFVYCLERDLVGFFKENADAVLIEESSNA